MILIGGNPTTSFRAGIDVDGMLYRIFVLSGVVAAFAGFLLAARTNGVTPNLGVGMLFEVFAAVVTSGVSLRGDIGGLSGVFAAVLRLSTIDTAINVMGHSIQNSRCCWFQSSPVCLKDRAIDARSRLQNPDCRRLCMKNALASSFLFVSLRSF